MGILRVKLFMTFNTQTNPIIQISKILLRFIRPMHTVSFAFSSTMLTSIWSASPSSNPFVKVSITNFFSLPIPNVSKLISFTICKSKTFFTAILSLIKSDISKVFPTNLTTNNDLFLALFRSALHRTKSPSISTRQEGLSALFAYFGYHNLNYNI